MQLTTMRDTGPVMSMSVMKFVDVQKEEKMKRNSNEIS